MDNSPIKQGTVTELISFNRARVKIGRSEIVMDFGTAQLSIGDKILVTKTIGGFDYLKTIIKAGNIITVRV
jgi:hypothetical protein